MSRTTNAVAVSTIGIDTGKNTLHLIGLDEQGMIVLREFVLGWKMLGLERSLGSRIVTYADDLVILCRKGKAEEALQRLARRAKRGLGSHQ